MKGSLLYSSLLTTSHCSYCDCILTALITIPKEVSSYCSLNTLEDQFKSVAVVRARFSIVELIIKITQLNNTTTWASTIYGNIQRRLDARHSES